MYGDGQFQSLSALIHTWNLFLAYVTIAVAGHGVLPGSKGEVKCERALISSCYIFCAFKCLFSSTLLAMNKGDVGHYVSFNQERGPKKMPLL